MGSVDLPKSISPSLISLPRHHFQQTKYFAFWTNEIGLFFASKREVTVGQDVIS